MRWCISYGRKVDGTPFYGSGQFGPFTPDDEPYWWKNRPEPDVGWAPTIEEAWERWEKQMAAWAEQHESRAADLRATIERTRRERGL